MVKKNKLGLSYLNATQFLGALNDNLYKFFLIYFLFDIYGHGRGTLILALAGGIFVIPFLLFSPFAGVLADRKSKFQIIIVTKIMELVFMLGGVAAFYFQSPLTGYIILFLMATQSALFGPSKYGIIPEIVPHSKISKANGYLSAFTYLAIIVGTFLASFLTKNFNRNFPLVSIACLFVAIAGLFTSYFIPSTQPSGSDKSYSWNFVREVWHTLKQAHRQGRLLRVILCGSFFLFLGGFTQLNVIPYAMQNLHLQDVDGSYLFLLTAFGIGVGSALAGKLSGMRVELGLVPFGAAGIALFLCLLGAGVAQVWVASTLLFLLGLSGGIFLVPLDSYIQSKSDSRQRGQNIAANNFMGFVGVLVASGLIYLLSDLLHLTAAQGFLTLGYLTLFLTIYLAYSLFGPTLIFLFRLKLHLFDRIMIEGSDQLPSAPSILLFAETKRWKESLLLCDLLDTKKTLWLSAKPLSLCQKLIMKKRLVLSSAEEKSPEGVIQPKSSRICLLVDKTDSQAVNEIISRLPAWPVFQLTVSLLRLQGKRTLNISLHPIISEPLA